MQTAQTNFSDLRKDEMLRAIGQMTVQAGLFMIAVSNVLKHLGNLPDTPVSPFIYSEGITNYEQKNTKGYFD